MEENKQIPYSSLSSDIVPSKEMNKDVSGYQEMSMTIDGKNVASKGLGGTALGLSIGALGAELLNGGLSGLFGNLGKTNNNGNSMPGVNDLVAAMAGAFVASGCNRNNNFRCGSSCCESDEFITRYEMNQEKQLAAKDNEIAILKSENFTNQKILEASTTILARVQNIENRLSALDVQNQATQDAIVQLKSDFCARLANEAEKRSCGDNQLANYVNATFCPKLVANITAGDTTTPQTLFNPVMNNCNCCNR